MERGHHDLPKIISKKLSATKFDPEHFKEKNEAETKQLNLRFK